MIYDYDRLLWYIDCDMEHYLYVDDDRFLSLNDR